MSDGTGSNTTNKINYLQPTTSTSPMDPIEQAVKRWQTNLEKTISTFNPAITFPLPKTKPDNRPSVHRCVVCTALTREIVTGHNGQDTLDVPCHDQCLDALVTVYPEYFKVED